MANYDPNKVTVILQSETFPGYVIKGFAEDSMISVTFNGETTRHVGAKGEVTYSDSADESADITINLKQTSPAFISVFPTLARKKESFTFNIIDNNYNGEIGVFNDNCRVQKQPDEEWGAEVGEPEVNILTGKSKRKTVLNSQ